MSKTSSRPLADCLVILDVPPFEAWQNGNFNIPQLAYNYTIRTAIAPHSTYAYGVIDMTTLPNVETDEWRCFYAEIEGEL